MPSRTDFSGYLLTCSQSGLLDSCLPASNDTVVSGSCVQRRPPRQHTAAHTPAIAQLVEHLTVDCCSNQMVPGSIPGGRIFSKAACDITSSTNITPYAQHYSKQSRQGYQHNWMACARARGRGQIRSSCDDCVVECDLVYWALWVY